MSFTHDEPVSPDFRPLHYLRIVRGHQDRDTGPEDVIGYVLSWDRKAWPFRYTTAVVWNSDEVTREVIEQERWMMQPRQYKSFEPFP